MTYIHCDRCGAVIGVESKVTPVYNILLREKKNYLDVRPKAVRSADLCEKCYSGVYSYLGLAPKVDEGIEAAAEQDDTSHEFVNRDL